MKKSFTVQQKESRNNDFISRMQQMSQKQRNGLFTDPLSLAVGDVYHVPKTRKRDSKGQVPVGPKGFFASKTKQGKSDAVLFSKSTYNGIDDPYDEAWKSFQLRSSVNSRPKSQRPFTAGGKAKQAEPTSFLK